MLIVWLGIALLSASWLYGLGYYHAPSGIGWAITVGLGVGCLMWWPASNTNRRSSWLAALCCVPAVVVTPWPYRTAFILLVVGMLVERSPILPAITRRVSRAGVVAGVVLLLQSLAITWYASFTARCHELPEFLAWLLGGVAQCLGKDVAVHGNTVALHSMRAVHRLGATWELLLDPASWCLLVAAFVLVCWLAWSSKQGLSFLLKSLVVVAVAFVVWLPIRAGVLMSLYLHDVLRTDYDAPLDAMRVFWSHGLHLALLFFPAVLCWRFLPKAPVSPRTDPTDSVSLVAESAWKCWVAYTTVAVGVALLTAGIYWDPIGMRQSGRVIVEEYHPDPEKVWEPTDRPYDTQWYGNRSGYNYYCIYDYCSRFFEMSRLTDRVSDEALRRCDVLILKVPTRPYSPPELRSIHRFVERGGGLLLIGEHTNVFRTSDYLNPVSRMFGFEFQDDCLFGIDSVFDEHYRRPFLSHPILHEMPSLDFATSCSIVPIDGHGRAVIQGRALKNLLADYHSDNYYPIPDDAAEMRYGTFVQLWATRYGRGRVVAFSDSTIFSNFSVFEPGKAELMLGMIQWLNHRSWLVNPRPWLLPVGVVFVLLGVAGVRIWPPVHRSTGHLVSNHWLEMTAAGVLGWSAAVLAVQLESRHAISSPTPVRPMTQIVIDRTLCNCPLSKNGFIGGGEDGFGIFERWLLRLGFFTTRREGPAVFDGDGIVFLRPDKEPSKAFCRDVVNYVAHGGRILIVDSAADPSSTTNDLLAPFDITVAHDEPIDGLLRTAEWPEVAVENAAVVHGGQAFAWIDDQCVGASFDYGRGSVIVVGFGSRFTDANMGYTGDVEPDEELRQVFELQFALLRAWLE